MSVRLYTDYERYGQLYVPPAPASSMQNIPLELLQPVETWQQTGYMNEPTPTGYKEIETYKGGAMSPLYPTRFLNLDRRWRMLPQIDVDYKPVVFGTIIKEHTFPSYSIFSLEGEPVGIAPISQGGVSGALGLPAMQYSEPRLNLEGKTLFTKIEMPDISPYADFGSMTFGDFPIPTESPTKSQLNAYKFAYTQGAAGAVAPATPYPISSHMIAATKGTPLAGVGEFSAGLVGSAESFWNPQVPSVWNVAYEKIGWQPGTYASDIMRQYPGYAAGNVLGEFALLGFPTGKSVAAVPRLLGKAGARVDAYLGLKAYPELRLGTMIRSFKENQAVVRAIRGMDGGTIRTSSETFAPRVASSWLTPGEMKGFMDDIADLPRVRVETPPKASGLVSEVSQGQRLKTSQLLQMERPSQILKAEPVEMPTMFPKLLTPGQVKRMLMAEDYALDFYTMPLPKQIPRPPSVAMKEMSKVFSEPVLKVSGAQTGFMKQAEAVEASLKPGLRMSTTVLPFAGVRARESERTGIFALPKVGTAEISRVGSAMKVELGVRQKVSEVAIPGTRLRYEVPRKMRYSRDDDWLPKAAKRSGGSYEERINPFNENFIRDLRRMKL